MATKGQGPTPNKSMPAIIVSGPVSGLAFGLRCAFVFDPVSGPVSSPRPGATSDPVSSLVSSLVSSPRAGATSGPVSSLISSLVSSPRAGAASVSVSGPASGNRTGNCTSNRNCWQPAPYPAAQSGPASGNCTGLKITEICVYATHRNKHETAKSHVK